MRERTFLILVPVIRELDAAAHAKVVIPGYQRKGLQMIGELAMTKLDFLSLLNSIDFPRHYWDLCDRFPFAPNGNASSGRKKDILAAFAEMGIIPRYYSRGNPCFTFEEEQIGGFIWHGAFVEQRHGGVELCFTGKSGESVVGSNFAVMAYDAKRFADPTFQRDKFKGPPPYPRPVHNGDPIALREIVKAHVALVREIKLAIKRKEAGNQEPRPL
jgi:hypothetical protein